MASEHVRHHLDVRWKFAHAVKQRVESQKHLETKLFREQASS
jgi:hypothetical protein